jgi:hypothetical protein
MNIFSFFIALFTLNAMAQAPARPPMPQGQSRSKGQAPQLSDELKQALKDCGAPGPGGDRPSKEKHEAIKACVEAKGLKMPPPPPKPTAE